MSSLEALLQLNDLDLLLGELRDPGIISRLKRAGFALGDPAAVERARARWLARLEPRWRPHYERALRRYGAAVATVRTRVCQGCFMSLPRSASPADPDALSLCESCGRILYWGRPGAI
ncbi:MAG TPA: hypothetical protein VL123_04270 [Candidatus Udaeobacter sp.]|jgi:hypothetical protein|nr:hypothetical protein [Candidatus Udaeobacter sp.]